MRDKNTKKEFQFADKTQQLIRANRFLAIAVTAYFMYIIALLAVSVLRGERSLGFCGLIGTMVVITLLITWIAFLKNKKSTKMRYVALVGQCLIGWVLAFAYSQDFAVLIGGFVLISGILYFDK